jgi:hypothetical protein
MTLHAFVHRCAMLACAALAAGATGCGAASPAGGDDGDAIEAAGDPIELPVDAARGVPLPDETPDR